MTVQQLLQKVFELLFKNKKQTRYANVASYESSMTYKNYSSIWV